ncbi:MAG: hypothetical protein QOE05_3030, partial [Actinomycetota bacterium]|nr:hypothetical protein [Actinomycetota bacterium]
MRASSLRRDVALAVAIGLTFWAAVAAAGIRLASDASHAQQVRELAAYREQVREVFTALYDDVQPMEDAFDIVWRQPAHDVFPARDLIASREVPGGIEEAEHRLAGLHVPAAVAGSARELAGKLHDLGTAVAGFPRLDQDREYLAVEFGAAGAAVETALYELSVPLRHVLGDRLPPVPGVEESSNKRPLSHASYIVGSAHICGPADKQLGKLPEVDDV